MRFKGIPKSQRVLLGSTLTLLLLAGGAVGALKFWPRTVVREVVPFNRTTRAVETTIDNWFETRVERVKVTDPIARKIVLAAHQQEGDAYDASYVKISYPNGDVPAGEGACTDVVIRSLRAAGVDLQKLIHEDMARDFGRYPDPWKLGHTDKNIDHRRVPNHITFLEKYGQSLPVGTSGKDLKTWLPGDIVYWKMDGNRWHTGIISDGIGPSGYPMVIHNAFQCIEQDYLTNWPIIGHFRYPGKK